MLSGSFWSLWKIRERLYLLLLSSVFDKTVSLGSLCLSTVSAGVELQQVSFSNAEVLSFTICLQTAYLAAVVHLAVHAWYFKEMLGIFWIMVSTEWILKVAMKLVSRSHLNISIVFELKMYMVHSFPNHSTELNILKRGHKMSLMFNICPQVTLHKTTDTILFLILAHTSNILNFSFK